MGLPGARAADSTGTWVFFLACLNLVPSYGKRPRHGSGVWEQKAGAAGARRAAVALADRHWQRACQPFAPCPPCLHSGVPWRTRGECMLCGTYVFVGYALKEGKDTSHVQ